MRKFQHKEILIMFDLLEKAYVEISDFVTIGDKESVILLLTDCQISIVNIGTFIEKIEDEDHPIISKMEEYCEMIYQLSLLIDDRIKFNDEFKELLVLHQRIELEVRQFSLKKEIVFLPYKAAMWDSLESIWLAAKDDADCQCFVIPIPYFNWDKNENTVTMRYEGDEFPDYVRITHYEEYNIKSRRPDAIYFHNPYDNLNLVTSVHPDYFSNELKKYTDLLVYIPYFATGGDLSEGFFELPSYFQADKIVIQSETMRQFYSKNIPDYKFIPLGSPKFDRIIYCNNNKPAITKDWARIINRRKIIFLNTSISSILEYNEIALKKIEYILHSFIDSEDYVLLWRPHPLTRFTLSSLRPNLLEEYCRIEKSYIDGQWGIYDNTPDVTMSVAIADAYIGEQSSSIVHLFGVIGKPIFIWNMNITAKLSKEDKYNIPFYDFHVDCDNLWFISTYTNVLCRMQLVNRKVEPIHQLLPVTYGRIEFLDVLKIENNVYMLPYQADHLCIYNLKDKAIIRIPILNSVNFNFDRMIPYKEYIFLKPKCYPAIVRYNRNNGEMVYYNEWIEHFIREDNLPMFLWGVETRDNLLFIASCQDNKVLAFDMDTGDYKLHRVGSSGSTYSSMKYDGHNYWFLPCEGSAIVRWNYETGKTIEYMDYPIHLTIDFLPFVNLIQFENYMFAFSSSTNRIIRFDTKTGEASEYNIELPQRMGKNGYIFAKKYDTFHIIAVTAIFNLVILINIQNASYQIIECKMDAILDYENKAKKFHENTEYYPYAWWESGYSTMDEFLEVILVDNLQRAEEQKLAYSCITSNLDGTSGAKIHTKIIEEINVR